MSRSSMVVTRFPDQQMSRRVVKIEQELEDRLIKIEIEAKPRKIDDCPSVYTNNRQR